MSNPKVLNLDTLETGVTKQITLNGKSYNMASFSVDSFIEQMREIEDMQGKNPSASESVEFVMRTIVRAFPGIPEAELRVLPMDHLHAIQEFVQAVAEEEAAEGNV